MLASLPLKGLPMDAQHSSRFMEVKQRFEGGGWGAWMWFRG